MEFFLSHSMSKPSMGAFSQRLENRAVPLEIYSPLHTFVLESNRT